MRNLQESMYQSLLPLLPGRVTFGTGMLEHSGGGQLRSNLNVDYRVSFDYGNPHYKEAVRKLYKEAGISLEEELERINSMPRIEPDPVALRYWSSPGRTHIGTPRIPLLRIHTTGDGLVYPSMAYGYEQLVEENGYTELYRSAWVNRWGHCTFSLAEWLTAIEIVEQRILTGEWPDTSPEALNILARDLNDSSPARFVESFIRSLSRNVPCQRKGQFPVHREC